MLPPTAGPFTSAFFNPALATSVTFHCSGHTLLEYMQVYWLGPLTGKGPCGQQARPAPDSGLGRTHEAFLVDMPVVQLRGGESIQGLLAVASLVQMREMGGSFSVPARDPRRGGGAVSGPSWFGCSHRGAGAREDGGGQGQQPCGHACRASSRTLSRGTRGGSYWSPSRPLWPLRLPAADLSPWAPPHPPYLLDGAMGSMELWKPLLPSQGAQPQPPQGLPGAGCPWSDEKAHGYNG